ncbi:MAG: carbon-nitrogen hydrolase family protein [Parachlamydiales bacterium]|nr:carbon-nitrogen hydrolase family protein [Parachlamydiales bacterium]
MIKIAAWQVTPKFEIADRINQFQSILKICKDDHIDFLCVPEGFITGYYEEESKARASALNINSQEFKDWIELTNGYYTTIVIGFNEIEDQLIYDSAAVVENGKLLGIQRKHYLYHTYFSAGSKFSVFKSKGITFGVLICLDTVYFEPARILALKGANILFSPMCNKVTINHPYAKRPNYYSHFVARSFENRCWLVTADWVWHNDGELVCPGNTVIYNPNGIETARSEENVEQILTQEISMANMVIEKGLRVKGSSILAKEIDKLTKFY